MCVSKRHTLMMLLLMAITVLGVSANPNGTPGFRALNRRWFWGNQVSAEDQSIEDILRPIKPNQQEHSQQNPGSHTKPSLPHQASNQHLHQKPGSYTKPNLPHQATGQHLHQSPSSHTKPNPPQQAAGQHLHQNPGSHTKPSHPQQAVGQHFDLSVEDNSPEDTSIEDSLGALWSGNSLSPGDLTKPLRPSLTRPLPQHDLVAGAKMRRWFWGWGESDEEHSPEQSVEDQSLEDQVIVIPTPTKPLPPPGHQTKPLIPQQSAGHYVLSVEDTSVEDISVEDTSIEDLLSPLTPGSTPYEINISPGSHTKPLLPPGFHTEAGMNPGDHTRPNPPKPYQQNPGSHTKPSLPHQASNQHLHQKPGSYTKPNLPHQAAGQHLHQNPSSHTKPNPPQQTAGQHLHQNPGSHTKPSPPQQAVGQHFDLSAEDNSPEDTSIEDSLGALWSGNSLSPGDLTKPLRPSLTRPLPQHDLVAGAKMRRWFWGWGESDEEHSPEQSVEDQSLENQVIVIPTPTKPLPPPGHQTKPLLPQQSAGHYVLSVEDTSVEDTSIEDLLRPLKPGSTPYEINISPGSHTKPLLPPGFHTKPGMTPGDHTRPNPPKPYQPPVPQPRPTYPVPPPKHVADEPYQEPHVPQPRPTYPYIFIDETVTEQPSLVSLVDVRAQIPQHPLRWLSAAARSKRLFWDSSEESSEERSQQQPYDNGQNAGRSSIFDLFDSNESDSSEEHWYKPNPPPPYQPPVHQPRPTYPAPPPKHVTDVPYQKPHVHHTRPKYPVPPPKHVTDLPYQEVYTQVPYNGLVV